MDKEVDAIGLVINQAVNIAFDDNDVDQLKKLIELQATYYTLLTKGLQPTPFERLSRLLKERLSLDDIDTPQLPEVAYKTPVRYMPEIQDENLRLTVKRINRECYGKLLDQDYIGHAAEGIRFWNELSPFHRSIVSRTINALLRNNKVKAGSVRISSLEDLMALRDMGAIKAVVALNLFAPIAEDSNT